ncbi:D-alanyl-D-alanine dipeptidase [Catalinimonas alkaloidigena]|uniref:M15 family metallopeptidase n=1 Tax=Catalinimonas alkaloidigena TaxID=1075417 RepID=UPI00240731B1|nr:M15 family metallopeptidase [Catalinimonas alkaloidigena]MDF9800040.1 D-alanyl-D-alanine dipeptidase [Catalinimonas alkaloidigena]
MRILNYHLGIGFCMSILTACQPSTKEESGNQKPDSLEARAETMIKTDTTESMEKASLNSLEESLIAQGLVKVKEVDSSIVVFLRYSTTNNFVGVDVYGDFDEAYMQPEPAKMLAQANQYLKETNPDYNLYIYDAVRPRSVQQILWDTLDRPIEDKHKYVANPQEGSIHNYGAAVDLTIADADGQPIDMGTDFDYFGVKAYPIHEEEMLEKGELSKAQVANRRLLREVMTRAGFSTITSEWWHFNAMSRAEADQRYGIVE